MTFEHKRLDHGGGLVRFRLTVRVCGPLNPGERWIVEVVTLRHRVAWLAERTSHARVAWRGLVAAWSFIRWGPP